MKINSPCKDCHDRTIGCHSACKSWDAYQKEKNELNHVIKAERTKYFNILQAEIDRKVATKKKRNK